MKIFFFWFAIPLAGCISSIPIVSEIDVSNAQQQWSGVTLKQLRSDRELYIIKCSGCHSLYKPDQYSDAEWNSILPTMNVKSKLNSVESEQIKRYIFLNSMK